MGYKDDIKYNFNLKIPTITSAVANSVIEDLLLDKALDRYLQGKQNLVEHRMKAAKAKYLKINPDVDQEMIKVEDLEGFDEGLVEAYRQAHSFEQGTVSGNVRDSKDKIKDALETKIIVSDK